VNGSLTQPFLAANLDFSAVSSFDDLVDADGLILDPVTDGRVIGEALIVTDDTTDQRFGVVGIAPYYLNTISSPGDVELLESDVEGTGEIIQTQVDRLYDDNGVRKIIVVSHLQDVDEDIALVQQLRNVDLIVAGGGDELLINSTVPTTTQLLPGDTTTIFADGDYPVQVQDADDRTVYIVTTSGSYQYLGRLDVQFNNTGEVTRILSDTSYIRRNIPEGPNAAANLTALGLNDAVAQDQDILDNVIDPVEACLAANDEPILGTAVEINITREDVRSRETNGGNLVTDAYIWAYNEYAATNGLDTNAPVIALQNGGGIRDDFGISSLPASGSLPGTVSLNDVNSALPFGNQMTVLEGVTPTDLKSIFERAASSEAESLSPPALSPAGEFMQVSGISVTYNISNTAQAIQEDGTVTTPGERVDAIQLDDGTFIVQDGEVVNGAPNVTIITNAFTAGGGDNYPWLEAITGDNRTEPLVDNGGVVVDYANVLIDYWQTFSATTIDGEEYPTVPASEYPPEGEDRINITAEGDGGGNGGNGDPEVTQLYMPFVVR
jgi:5'-nucleotidase